jgi:tyrosyl-tRNA synthetase
VHGVEEADRAIAAVGALFGNNMDLDNVPSCKIDRDLLAQGINVVDLLTLSRFLPSKSEARRVIQQGGIAVNGKKIENAEVIIDLDSIDNDCILLKKGKKTFLKLYYTQQANKVAVLDNRSERQKI